MKQLMKDDEAPDTVQRPARVLNIEEGDES
jgi:hypothetical protein